MKAVCCGNVAVVLFLIVPAIAHLPWEMQDTPLLVPFRQFIVIRE